MKCKFKIHSNFPKISPDQSNNDEV